MPLVSQFYAMGQESNQEFLIGWLYLMSRIWWARYSRKKEKKMSDRRKFKIRESKVLDFNRNTGYILGNTRDKEKSLGPLCTFHYESSFGIALSLGLHTSKTWLHLLPQTPRCSWKVWKCLSPSGNDWWSSF